jgi:NADPH2:quinone reductase
MRALLCTHWGSPDELELGEMPDPVPGPGEVVLRVEAAGVNFPDALIVQNKYQTKPALPFAPGIECAGIVETVGAGVADARPGDRVITQAPYGTFAEKLACPAAGLVAMPDGLDFVTASAFILTYGTSYHALADRAALRPGETLLVLGASGGVGLAAIELGKALGARVIAAASSAAKLAICRERGADETIDYGSGGLREALARLTGGRGVDVVFDPVGGDFTEAALRSLAWRGRLLVVGFANGEIPRVPMNLVLLKGAALIGVYVGRYVATEPGHARDDRRQLLRWLGDGRLRPLIAATYQLARGAEALTALLERRVSGKLVILPQA